MGRGNDRSSMGRLRIRRGCSSDRGSEERRGYKTGSSGGCGSREHQRRRMRHWIAAGSDFEIAREATIDHRKASRGTVAVRKKGKYFLFAKLHPPQQLTRTQHACKKCDAASDY